MQPTRVAALFSHPKTQLSLQFGPQVGRTAIRGPGLWIVGFGTLGGRLFFRLGAVGRVPSLEAGILYRVLVRVSRPCPVRCQCCVLHVSDERV